MSRKQRTDTERLRYLEEYIDGVEPVEMAHVSGALTCTGRGWWLIRPVDDGVRPQWHLGEGCTLGEALDTFCDYVDREHPVAEIDAAVSAFPPSAAPTGRGTR